jgi:hypothetical protein
LLPRAVQVALQRVATAQTALQDYLQLGLLDKPPAQVPSVFVQVPNNMLLMEPLVQNTANSTVFFAGVTPTVAVETLLNVFARFGRVMDLNLFRPYKGCRTSKVRQHPTHGCDHAPGERLRQLALSGLQHWGCYLVSNWKSTGSVCGLAISE